LVVVFFFLGFGVSDWPVPEGVSFDDGFGGSGVAVSGLLVGGTVGAGSVSGFVLPAVSGAVPVCVSVPVEAPAEMPVDVAVLASSGVAHARPAGAAMAEPMPSATASAPTRPTYLADRSAIASPSPISDLLLSASFGLTVRNGSN
jgi:hypothetical protein